MLQEFRNILDSGEWGYYTLSSFKMILLIFLRIIFLYIHRSIQMSILNRSIRHVSKLLLRTAGCRATHCSALEDGFYLWLGGCDLLFPSTQMLHLFSEWTQILSEVVLKVIWINFECLEIIINLVFQICVQTDTIHQSVKGLKCAFI